ncbi:phage major capsid protein [uncultured Sulfitobacter sp.]|uniref:phage major capsid protein n=1 Tax=uncultured Sulfitobacter sp. TaxID=191468 RepID=UPI0030DCBCDE|tara:strand:- start:13695 stop:14978 length:1284 start_codon:yes stop_codon:yes gene_type:complete
MATIKELREQAAKTLTEARSMLDGINDKSTKEQRAEAEIAVDKALAETAEIEARAERMGKLEAAEKRAEEARDLEERQAREAKRPGVDAAEARQGGDMDYRTAFHAYLRAEGQMGAMDAEARSVLSRGYTTVEQRAQTTTNTAGGYTVPTELMNILIKSMQAWGPMYSEDVATVLTTSGGGQITMPTVNDTAVTAGAHTEGATLTDDGGKDVTFGQKVLEAFAYDTEWLRVSKELADDSIMAMEQVLGDLLGERLGRIANLQLTTGSGSSAPNGVVTASTLGKTATGTAAITGDEIIDLVHSIDPAYRMGPKVQFMFNDSTLAAIRKLKDGDGNYLWQMGNVQQGQPGSLLGYSYRVNQAMGSLAAGNKVMLFGDFGKYYVRKVGAPLIGALQDKDFWPGFGVAGYIRFDGELADTAAIKHLITAAV